MNDKEQIKANLDMLSDLANIEIPDADPFNLFVIKTPKGSFRIKSNLTKEQFIKNLNETKSKTNPASKKVIEKKLKEAKQKRLIKNIAFDKTITAKNKLMVIKQILNAK